MRNLSKINIIILISIFSLASLLSEDFTFVDELYRLGKYEEGFKILEENFEKDDTDPAVIWRKSRMIYEIADAMPEKNKKEKIAKFTEGMEISKPYLDIKDGDKLDLAQMIFWYAVNYGARGEVIGIKESLDILPDLYKLADKSLAHDPTYAAPYLFKGRIDDTVPSFLGGDKFRMAINFSKAIKYNQKDMNILVDAANAFIKRNWDKEKKQNIAVKKNMTDETPQDMSDREYAKILLNQAVDLYKSFNKPSARDKAKYEQALSLLKKISKK